MAAGAAPGWVDTVGAGAMLSSDHNIVCSVYVYLRVPGLNPDMGA